MRGTALPLTLLLLVLPLAAPAQSQLDREATLRIDALFEPWDRPGSPGAAVGVVRDGELVFARGYGEANLEYGIPITPASVFHVASVSKHFTAFAIGLLAEEGHLSLDDEVGDHLFDFPDFGERITIRHLIHHTSGIRDQWELLAMAGWRLDDVITHDQILSMMRHQQELNFAPGEEYLYSNMGYTLLAEIVSRVSGTPFPAFLEERVFGPLGMERTHVHDDHRHIVPDRAYSYAPQGNGFRHAPLNYANAGATSLFTTVDDLARWERNFRTARVGSPELLAGMQEDRGVLNDGSEIAYAHALMVGEHGGLRTVGHGGADAGYRAQLVRYPEQGLAVIVLSNLSALNAGGMARQVAAVLLQEELERPAAGPPAVDRSGLVEVSADELAALEGLWVAPETHASRRLRLEDGALHLSGGSGAELGPLGGGRFRALGAPSDLELTIEPSPDGPGPLRMREVRDGEPGGVFYLATGASPHQLPAYVGSYHSPELGTTYTLRPGPEGLVATHRRHEPVPLLPTLPDHFTGGAWWFRNVRFTRGADGQVDGFLLTGNRVRNLRFDRVEEGTD